MACKFVVRTETGKHDSLREPVQVILTLTPVEPKQSTPSSYPARLWIRRFNTDVDSREVLGLSPGFSFSRYEIRGEDKGGTRFLSASPPIWPGESANLLRDGLWDTGLRRSTMKQSTVTTTNNSGSTQHIGLTVRSLDNNSAHPIALYENIQAGGSLSVPTDLVLQGYVIDASKDPGWRLKPEHLTRPLFPIPLNCNTLPPLSSWKLSQDRNGDIKLINDGDVELGNHSIETLAKSIGDVHDLLSLIFKTLNETQNRLTVFEGLLGDNQAQLSTTKQDLVAARNQISLLDRTIPKVETKTAQLETLLTRAEDRVTRVEESVTVARAGLESSEKGLSALGTQLLAVRNASDITRGTLEVVQESSVTTQDQLSALGDKIPRLEEQLSNLGTAFGNNEKRVSVMGSSLIAQKNRLSDLADQLPRLEAKSNQIEKSYSLDKLSTMQESVDLAHDHLSTLDCRVLAVESKTDSIATDGPSRPARVGPDLAKNPASRDEGADRVPAMQAKAEELERSFGEMKKDVSVIRKLLRTRLPALESKSESLEKSVIQTQEELSGVQTSLASSSERIAGLDTRMAVVEGTLQGIRAGPNDVQPSTSSRSRSPLLFPGHSSLTHTSTPSPSREAAFFEGEDTDSDVG